MTEAEEREFLERMKAAPPHPVAPKNTTPIASLIAEYEKDPVMREALIAARKKLAETLYADELAPPSEAMQKKLSAWLEEATCPRVCACSGESCPLWGKTCGQFATKPKDEKP